MIYVYVSYISNYVCVCVFLFLAACILSVYMCFSLFNVYVHFQRLIPMCMGSYIHAEP